MKKVTFTRRAEQVSLRSHGKPNTTGAEMWATHVRFSIYSLLLPVFTSHYLPVTSFFFFWVGVGKVWFIHWAKRTREGDKRSIVLVNLHLSSMAAQEAAAVQSEGSGLGDQVELRLVRLADPLKWVHWSEDRNECSPSFSYSPGHSRKTWNDLDGMHKALLPPSPHSI